MTALMSRYYHRPIFLDEQTDPGLSKGLSPILSKCRIRIWIMGESRVRALTQATVLPITSIFTLFLLLNNSQDTRRHRFSSSTRLRISHGVQKQTLIMGKPDSIQSPINECQRSWNGEEQPIAMVFLFSKNVQALPVFITAPFIIAAFLTWQTHITSPFTWAISKNHNPL